MIFSIIVNQEFVLMYDNLTRKINFSFTDPPIVTMKPENITVNETVDFIIFCDYEANPATLTRVSW